MTALDPRRALMIQGIGSGYRPDPPGHDEPFEIRAAAGRTGATVAVVSSEVRLEERTPISEQANSDCVANAWCDAMELIMPPDDVRQISRRAAYWISRAQHGEECVDGGTYVRTAANVSRDVGVCLESLWPYSSPVNQRPSLAALQQCWDNRIDGHYAIRVSGSTDRERRADKRQQLRDALEGGFPIVGAFALGDPWMDLGRSSPAVEPPNGQPIVGWHAMVIVGFRVRSDGSIEWEIRNSWGTAWGKDGHGFMTDAYVLDTAFANDFRVPTRAPSF